MALKHWLQLSLTAGVGPVLARRMIAATASVDAPALAGAGGGLVQQLVPVGESAERACRFTERELRTVEGIGTAKASAIHRALQIAAGEVDDELRRAFSLGVQVICPADQAYPVLLRLIHDPPLVLYVRGGLEPRDLNAVSIVGSRKCTHYGREQAERFGALLAGAGVTVVSGGARGVDSAAHRGAMRHPQGRTIAVLGSGVDVAYPPENAGLFGEIATRGAVISEFPLGTPPVADNFPRRNRIVAGMSRGVLVVEAAERSGALITARVAGEEDGRTIFALPGRVDNPMAAGPHQLLRDGATLATNLEDILEGLTPLPDAADRDDRDDRDDLFHGIELSVEPDAPPAPATPPPAPAQKTAAAGLSDRQRRILDQLAGGEAGVDRIIDLTGLAAPVVLQELTFLSLKGLIRRIDGQTYARRG